MFRFLRLWLGTILRLFRSRQDLLVENLALRQQLSVFKRRNRRPKLIVLDKLFWVLAQRLWSDWKMSLLVVAPETVVRWHRAGFRLYWSMISKIGKRVGRRRISREVPDLIFRMVAENPTWGAPRIHGEGFEQRSKIKVTLDIPDNFERLPSELETAIFRVVQECLTSIHRHSGSRLAAIRVTRDGNELKVEVRDQGKGMPSANGRKVGVGVQGMRERITQFGGRFEIRSDKKGTTVIAIVPVPNPSAHTANQLAS